MKIADLYQSEFCLNCSSILLRKDGICSICNTKNDPPNFVPESKYILDNSYEINKCVGKGGMGNVYEINHLELNEKRALKVMKLDYALDEEMKKRFLREAKLLSSMDNIYLVGLYDFGCEDDLTFYIIMEYIDGFSLKTFLSSGLALSLDAKLFLFKDILQGISKMHSKQIVHRDLSLENIMVLKETDSNVLIKIIDLGLGKNLKKTEDITKRELFFGKFLYAPPEYFDPTAKNIDYFKVDVYSLGIILYYLISNKFPFYAKSTRELINLILSREVPVIENIDPNLSKIVYKAIAKNPAERYANAEEFFSYIDNYLKKSGKKTDGEEVKSVILSLLNTDIFFNYIQKKDYHSIISYYYKLQENELIKKLIDNFTKCKISNFYEEKLLFLEENLFSENPLEKYYYFIAFLDLFAENHSS